MLTGQKERKKELHHEEPFDINMVLSYLLDEKLQHCTQFHFDPVYGMTLSIKPNAADAKEEKYRLLQLLPNIDFTKVTISPEQLQQFYIRMRKRFKEAPDYARKELEDSSIEAKMQTSYPGIDTLGEKISLYYYAIYGATFMNPCFRGEWDVILDKYLTLTLSTIPTWIMADNSFHVYLNLNNQNWGLNVKKGKIKSIPIQTVMGLQEELNLGQPKLMADYFAALTSEEKELILEAQTSEHENQQVANAEKQRKINITRSSARALRIKRILWNNLLSLHPELYIKIHHFFIDIFTATFIASFALARSKSLKPVKYQSRALNWWDMPRGWQQQRFIVKDQALVSTSEGGVISNYCIPHSYRLFPTHSYRYVVIYIDGEKLPVVNFQTVSPFPRQRDGGLPSNFSLYLRPYAIFRDCTIFRGEPYQQSKKMFIDDEFILECMEYARKNMFSRPYLEPQVCSAELVLDIDYQMIYKPNHEMNHILRQIILGYFVIQFLAKYAVDLEHQSLYKNLAEQHWPQISKEIMSIFLFASSGRESEIDRSNSSNNPAHKNPYERYRKLSSIRFATFYQKFLVKPEDKYAGVPNQSERYQIYMSVLKNLGNPSRMKELKESKDPIDRWELGIAHIHNTAHSLDHVRCFFIENVLDTLRKRLADKLTPDGIKNLSILTDYALALCDETGDKYPGSHGKESISSKDYFRNKFAMYSLSPIDCLTVLRQVPVPALDSLEKKYEIVDHKDIDRNVFENKLLCQILEDGDSYYAHCCEILNLSYEDVLIKLLERFDDPIWHMKMKKLVPLSFIDYLMEIEYILIDRKMTLLRKIIKICADNNKMLDKTYVAYKKCIKKPEDLGEILDKLEDGERLQFLKEHAILLEDIISFDDFFILLARQSVFIPDYELAICLPSAWYDYFTENKIDILINKFHDTPQKQLLLAIVSCNPTLIKNYPNFIKSFSNCKPSEFKGLEFYKALHSEFEQNIPDFINRFSYMLEEESVYSTLVILISSNPTLLPVIFSELHKNGLDMISLLIMEKLITEKYSINDAKDFTYETLSKTLAVVHQSTAVLLMDWLGPKLEQILTVPNDAKETAVRRLHCISIDKQGECKNLSYFRQALDTSTSVESKQSVSAFSAQQNYIYRFVDIPEVEIIFKHSKSEEHFLITMSNIIDLPYVLHVHVKNPNGHSRLVSYRLIMTVKGMWVNLSELDSEEIASLRNISVDEYKKLIELHFSDLFDFLIATLKPSYKMMHKNRMDSTLLHTLMIKLNGMETQIALSTLQRPDVAYAANHIIWSNLSLMKVEPQNEKRDPIYFTQSAKQFHTECETLVYSPISWNNLSDHWNFIINATCQYSTYLSYAELKDSKKQNQVHIHFIAGFFELMKKNDPALSNPISYFLSHIWNSCPIVRENIIEYILQTTQINLKILLNHLCDYTHDHSTIDTMIDLFKKCYATQKTAENKLRIIYILLELSLNIEAKKYIVGLKNISHFIHTCLSEGTIKLNKFYFIDAFSRLHTLLMNAALESKDDSSYRENPFLGKLFLAALIDEEIDQSSKKEIMSLQLTKLISSIETERQLAPSHNQFYFKPVAGPGLKYKIKENAVMLPLLIDFIVVYDEELFAMLRSEFESTPEPNEYSNRIKHFIRLISELATHLTHVHSVFRETVLEKNRETLLALGVINPQQKQTEQAELTPFPEPTFL